MELNAGASYCSVNAFDVFSHISLDSILFVVPVVSAASTDSDGVFMRWDTWNGRNRIVFITPIAQTVFFNCAVFYAE